MASPGVRKIVRPYQSVEEYLSHEGATLSAKEFLLVDQPWQQAETAIRFEVALASGEKIIRGEGVVIEYVGRTSASPGGLRVRFRRFDGKTKEIIERALAHQGGSRTAAESPQAEAPPSAPLEAGSPSPQPEQSGVRHRPRAPVPPPPGREALLERLRRRAPTKVGLTVKDDKTATG